MIGRVGGGATPLDVQGVVTLGSPIFNRDSASKVANLVEIRDKYDIIGLPFLRSNEGRTNLSLDPLSRDSNAGHQYTLDGSATLPVAAHSRYWKSNDVSNILQREFGLQLKN